MSVSYRQPLTSAGTNAAFVSKTADSTVTSKINLNNASSTNVPDAQAAIVKALTVLGTTPTDASPNDYSSNNYITDGDNRKVAIEKLDTQLKTTTDNLATETTTNLTQDSRLTALETGVRTAALGGTGQSSYTAGDILFASSGSALSKLGIGSNGQVLTLVSGLPAWQPAASGTGITVGAQISSTGVVTGETQNFINGNASYSGGTCTITLNTFFSSISSVQCTLIGDVTAGSLGVISVSSASTTSIVVKTSTPGSGNINRDFFITVTGT